MDSMPLFDLPEEKERGLPQSTPLAARMRPETFAEFVGQEHLIADGRVLRKCIEADQLPSMVFWGPPGSGKTTLAHIIANVTRAQFSPLSAVSAGVVDLRRVIGEAKKRLQSSGQRTILFIDEIHRFNKAQQDAVLPFVENGTVTFIGATTENPSFEVIAPLLSRCRVFRLNLLSDNEIRLIVERAIKDVERGLGKLQITISEEALSHLVTISNGDARVALNALEMAAFATVPDSDGSRSISLSAIEEALQHRALLYDKSGDQHYDLISALHKSLRGSDPDAALYWLGRMLEAGEDPLYIARRGTTRGQPGFGTSSSLSGSRTQKQLLVPGLFPGSTGHPARPK
jgi:putative ATPase